MAAEDRSRLLATADQWIALVVCAALGLILFTFVDLAPKVEADFFFATDDPQLQSSVRIEEQFGNAPQIFVAAQAPRLATRDYIQRLHRLTEDLRRVDGVDDARSITRGPKEPEEILQDEPAEVFEDLAERPFWRRLLLAPDNSASFVVLRLGADADPIPVVAGIDRVIARHDQAGFRVAASGVPYVSDHIRQRLDDDLRTFSTAAFVAFAVLVGLLFRSLAVLIGTMVAALATCFGTFLVRPMLGMHGDILMPNLWTIAFVLTLSHVVYLTAEWQRRAPEVGAKPAVREAIGLTGPASRWSLVANLLGFASLIFVSAQPLRQFGISGAIAALLAMATAYLLFPPFLRAARPRAAQQGPVSLRLERFFTSRHAFIAAGVAVTAIALAPLTWRLNTDPQLPSYFGANDPIRTGLEAIDRAGGSSPLDIVIADARGQSFDDGEAVGRLQALERRLERHPDVGAVLSIASLMGEAQRPWYAFLFSWEKRLDQLDSAKADRVGRTFLSEDRRRARFILRMREAARDKPRATVVSEVTGIVRSHGFTPVLVGGLFPLQAELSTLVQGSVLRGLSGLIAMFFFIAWIVTRSMPTALAMAACLLITPGALFGLVGLFRMPLDIISAPAANVALPLGIDEMIHLGYAVRRRKSEDESGWSAWRSAIQQLWRPILISMMIVASGFMLLLLSNFPPTQRLGILVCAGAIITDLVVLLVLPAVAARKRRHAIGSEK